MTGRAACTAAALMLACGEPAGPPSIAYGLEECDHCRMIVSEEVHAAAVVGSDGVVRTFDDLGCLLASRAPLAADGTRVWVHDIETAEWLDAGDAVFLTQDPATTPMGSGLVAIATRERAVRRAGAESIYDFEELLSRGGVPDGRTDNDENDENDEEETLR